MARYTGPKHRLCRRIGYCLWEDPKCPSKKRPFPPGQQGQNRRRSKQSGYSRHLLEKQKLRLTYGLLEGQFRNTFGRAQKMRGITGDNFLQLLECRLDNLVYRLGFSNSIFSARQVVAHGHVEVDGKKVDIPSYHVRVGQRITIREKSKASQMFAESRERTARRMPSYLECEVEKLEGRLAVMPRIEEIPVKVDTNLIVEFYSK